MRASEFEVKEAPFMKTVLSSCALLALAGAALGDTIGVCPNGCDFEDIQEAIDAAEDGDVIAISPGTFIPQNALDTHGKAVTLQGSFDKSGAPITTIRDSNQHPLIVMSSDEGADTVVQHIIFENGYGSSGGAVSLAGASPIFRNCIFDDNRAELAGGAVYCSGGSNPLFYFCTFTNNTCSYDGGAVCNIMSTPTFEFCTFEGNTASGGSGGGMVNYSSSDVELIGCAFLGNTASSQGGGGMFNSNSAPQITSCTFEGNSTSGEGGGMYNYQSSPTIQGSLFVSNSANIAGGAMGNRDDSLPIILDTEFKENTSSQGAGIRNRDSSPTLIECYFYENIASYDGGAIANYNSCHPIIHDCRFLGNVAKSASGGGGAIFAYGQEERASHVTVTDSEFFANTTAGGGGGFLNNSFYSTAEFQGCTFISNSAMFGNAIANIEGSISSITDCEFSECCAVDPLTTAIDQGGNHTLYICEGCEGDVNCDGEVTASDLGRVIAAWGPSVGRYDLNADGVVNGLDLGLLFATWGPCR